MNPAYPVRLPSLMTFRHRSVNICAGAVESRLFLDRLMRQLEWAPIPDTSAIVEAANGGLPDKDAQSSRRRGVAKADILLTGARAHLGHLDGEAVGELLLLSLRETLARLLAYSQILPERIGLRYFWAGIHYTVPIYPYTLHVIRASITYTVPVLRKVSPSITQAVLTIVRNCEKSNTNRVRAIFGSAVSRFACRTQSDQQNSPGTD